MVEGFSQHFPSIVFRIPEGRQVFEEENPDIEKRNRDIEDRQSEVEENEAEHRPNVKAVQKSKKIKPGVTKEWSHEETLRLIELWESEEVLYNIKHRGYSNKDQRNNGLQRVKEGLEESRIVADAKEIGSKLHSLRVYYSAQGCKLENSKKSGSGTDDVKKIKWTVFDKLAFLNDNLQPRQTFSNIIHVDDYSPESPASSIGSIENPSLRKLPKKGVLDRPRKVKIFTKKNSKCKPQSILKK